MSEERYLLPKIKRVLENSSEPEVCLVLKYLLEFTQIPTKIQKDGMDLAFLKDDGGFVIAELKSHMNSNDLKQGVGQLLFYKERYEIDNPDSNTELILMSNDRYQLDYYERRFLKKYNVRYLSIADFLNEYWIRDHRATCPCSYEMNLYINDNWRIEDRS